MGQDFSSCDAAINSHVPTNIQLCFGSKKISIG
jgi:hypothetical protein